MRAALLALLLAFLLGATEASAQTTPTFGEKAVGSTDCKNGAFAADFDTLAQCTSTSSTTGTMQKAPIFVGAVTSPPYPSTTCDSSKAGMMQYTASAMQYCNGTAWTGFGAVASGYNAQSMVAGWPDAIVCQVNTYGGTFIYYLSTTQYISNTYVYKLGQNDGVRFLSDGTFSSYIGTSSENCNVSIATLIANGRAFNIANGQAGGTAEMQDGTAGAPGLYFSADPNTGFYRPAADTVAIATNGSEKVRINASGQVALNSITPTAGAILDLAAGTGTALSSMIVPKDTTANRPTTGVEGMIRYNTTTKAFEGYQGPTPAWASMSNMPIPSGVILTGNVYGLNISKTAANQLTITKGVAMDSTNRLVLTLAADDTLSIPSSASTIYHVFVVRLVADGSIDTRAYTTESGVESDVQVDAWRWIGFVRTNASSNICGFIMNGDLVEFLLRSENLLATLPILTLTSMSHSSLVPTARISEISYGFRANDTASLYIRDSANTATRASYGNVIGTSTTDKLHTWHRDGYGAGIGMLAFQDPAYGSVSDYGGNVYIHMVRIKR